MIVTIAGRTGAGKTTLEDGLLDRLPRARRLISITTRPLREDDRPGAYLYVPKDGFERLVEKDVILKPFDVHGHLFGTRKNDLRRALTSGASTAILTVEGMLEFHAFAKKIGREHVLRYFYLDVDDEDELRRRMRERGDTESQIEIRLVESRHWGQWARSAQKTLNIIFVDASISREAVLDQVIRRLQG